MTKKQGIGKAGGESASPEVPFSGPWQIKLPRKSWLGVSGRYPTPGLRQENAKGKISAVRMKTLPECYRNLIRFRTSRSQGSHRVVLDQLVDTYSIMEAKICIDKLQDLQGSCAVMLSSRCATFESPWFSGYDLRTSRLISRRGARRPVKSSN